MYVIYQRSLLPNNVIKDLNKKRATTREYVSMKPNGRTYTPFHDIFLNVKLCNNCKV